MLGAAPSAGLAAAHSVPTELIVLQMRYQIIVFCAHTLLVIGYVDLQITYFWRHLKSLSLTLKSQNPTLVQYLKNRALRVHRVSSNPPASDILKTWSDIGKGSAV